MKKKLSFRTRLLSLFASSILFVCALRASSIYIIDYEYRKNNIDASIQSRHNALDESLSSLIEDSNYIPINIFTEENISKIDSSKDQETFFQEIYLTQPVSGSFRKGMAYYRTGKQSLFAVSQKNTRLPEITTDIVASVRSKEDNSYPISYCFSTYNNSGSYRILGKKLTEESACFLYLDSSWLRQLINSITCLEENYIIDSNRNIVLSKNVSELGAVILDSAKLGINKNEASIHTEFNNVDSYISVHSRCHLKQSFAFSWQIISVQDYDALFGPLKTLRIVLIVFTIAAFLVAAWTSYYLSKKISMPLTALSNELERTNLNKPGDFPYRKEITTKDEIEKLEISYHERLDRIHELREENREKRNQQRILELESLQRQINPHFLYNTLDTISWLAKINGQKEIDSLVRSLAKFFRLTLHSGDKIITVKEEMEITKHYLEIQSARFPERFQYEFNADKSLEDERTLKLILQPVVENSVKYAFDPKKGKFLLKISTIRLENSFEYIVEDNGTGFVVPENLFEKKKQPNGKSSGFGLYNVQERIHLEYGDKYGRTVTSEVGKGTKTIIRLPLFLSPASSHKK